MIIIASAVAAVALTGCGTQRRAAATVTMSGTASSVCETASVAEGSKAETESSDSASAIEVITEEYDTSLPVSAETGTPPIRTRTTLRRGTRMVSRRTDSSVVRFADTSTAASSIYASSETSETYETAGQAEEKKGLTWLQKTMVIIGASTLAYAILRMTAGRLLPKAKSIKNLFKIFK